MPARPPVPVDRVKQLLDQGVKQQVIVQRLGVSKSVVSCIAHGTYLEPRK
jgi:predicted XRE-type DNA-binding protein